MLLSEAGILEAKCREKEVCDRTPLSRRPEHDLLFSPRRCSIRPTVAPGAERKLCEEVACVQRVRRR